MKGRFAAVLTLVGASAPCALGQKIADCDWSVPLTLVTIGDPPPPIDVTSVDFLLTNTQSSLGLYRSLGDGALVLTSGQTGSVDLSAATDPVDFAYFADRFSQGFGDVYLSLGIGPDFTQFFTNTTATPALQTLFTPDENNALAGADISFFRITVDDLTIVNGAAGDPTRADITASGTFEIWIPAPGATALFGLAGLPLVTRRRR